MPVRRTSDAATAWAHKRQLKRAPRGEFGPFAQATRLPFFDHPSIWRGQDGWVIVLQPYHLELDDLRSLVTFCEQHGFASFLDPLANWHDRRAFGVVIATGSNTTETCARLARTDAGPGPNAPSHP